MHAGARWQETARGLVVPAAGVAALTALLLAIGLTGVLERLAYLPTRNTPPAPQGVEEVFFHADDGTRLHGWFLPSEGPAIGSVLVLHGNAGNVANHAGFVDWLPPAGFDVFLFDYRGYGLSDDGRLRRHELYRDAHAALDALAARDGVAAGRIVLFAQSLGTAFGSHLMAERDEIRAGVLVSAFASWRAMAASAFGIRGPGRAASLVGALLLPSGLDPVDAVGRVGGRPLLLVHGSRDEIVPFAHAEALVEAAGPGARLRTVEGGDHNGLFWVEPAVMGEIAAFYREALAEASDGSS